MNHQHTSAIATTLIATFLMSANAQTHSEPKETPMPSNSSMPAPAAESGNIYARGMAAILTHLGKDISYDQIMGLSGVAFILQVDASGPIINGNELDCAWWPNDDWGFELGLPLLCKAAGMQFSKVNCDMSVYRADPATEYNRALRPRIKKSLDDGKPVLSYGFVGTEIDDKPLPLLGYGTAGKSTSYSQKKIRIDRYPWHVYLVGSAVEPVTQREVDVASLRHIIALFNESAQGNASPKTRFSGKQAWAEWLRLLRDGQACDNNMLIHLRYNRRSAVVYLREMAKRYNGATAAHLSASADIYQRILDELMKQGMPWNRVKSGEAEQTVRESFTAMVERVSKLEAQAITDVEAALTSDTGKQ